MTENYSNYSVNNETGEVFNTKRNRLQKPVQAGRYTLVSINGKLNVLSRFLWLYNNGPIPFGYEVDHINDDPSDNRLSNLQLLTKSENRRKSAVHRDKFIYSNKQKRPVRCIDEQTGETTVYPSQYSVQKVLGINSGMVAHCLKGVVRDVRSKANGRRYRFELDL